MSFWNLPKAVDPRDSFVVVNQVTGNNVESHPTMKGANDAAEILNKHETRNGRHCIYKVITR